ncbi:unnamed protein product [Vicia faba]|uniref:Trichome birefringence-like C-terminal domain-containing protein n=1 Tax=Vicia faba TaxID=3906 RepID=A0AAV1AKE8_VICFA|nr:unnamed protein product [Vicia faba]
MSRTQWESLICMLMAGVEDKMNVYKVNLNQISKRIKFLGVRFSDFNFTVEYSSIGLLGATGLGSSTFAEKIFLYSILVTGRFHLSFSTWVVISRTFEPSHWRDQTRRTCNVTQYQSCESRRTGAVQHPLAQFIGCGRGDRETGSRIVGSSRAERF